MTPDDVSRTGSLPPGTLVSVRQQLEEAAAAMDATLRQAAWSAGIGRSAGTAAGFYAATGSLLVGGRESHPLLLEAAAEALGFLVKQQAAAGRGFAPGEVYWTNDPRCHAAGLEDLILASPLVREGRAICFVVLTANHPALGRATLAPAESLRREGLVLPWTRVGRAGRIQAEILDLLAANAEMPARFLADLEAHLHAMRLGQGVLEELLERHGTETLAAVWEALGAGCRRGLAKILDRLEVETLEGRVAPFAVRVRRQKGDGVTVSVEAPGGGRVPGLTRSLALAAVRAAFRQVLSAETPALGILGDFGEAIRVQTPWDEAPASTAVGEARYAGAQGLAEAVLAAFAAPLAHLSRAPDAACLLLDLRGERADGSRYRMRLGLGGGLGASVFGDGMSHGAPPFSAQRLRPVEEIERIAPLRVLRFQLRPDSAGAGQYRGGLGALLELELLEGRAEADVLLPGRAIGLRGGMRGGEARLTLVTPAEGAGEESGPARVTHVLWAGHRLILESPGGGGWGIPFQRSIMRLEEDLARGLVGRDQAKNRYGLILKAGSQEKDDHLTYRVRHYLLSTLAADDIIAGEELLD